MLAFEIIYCLYTLVFLGLKVIQIAKERRVFFSSFWNWLDVCIIGLSVAAIGVYAEHTMEVSRVVRVYRANPTVSFHRAFTLDTALLYILSSIVMLGAIKFLHILRFNPRIYLFSSVLQDARPLIISYVFNAVIFEMAFVCLFYILLGAFAENYRSILATVGTLFMGNVAILPGDLDPYFDLHYLIGPTLFLVYYMIRIYILANLVITILMETMSRLAKDPLPDEDVAFVKHMIERFQHYLMMKRKEIAPDNE